MQFNDYDHTVAGCEFRDCGIGVNSTVGANFYLRDSHFENSKIMDIHVRVEHGVSVRRCTSTGSTLFLAAATIAPLTIQDCQVAGWTNPTGAVTLNSTDAPSAHRRLTRAAPHSLQQQEPRHGWHGETR
jgi:hypothetical protein